MLIDSSSEAAVSDMSEYQIEMFNEWSLKWLLSCWSHSFNQGAFKAHCVWQDGKHSLSYGINLSNKVGGNIKPFYQASESISILSRKKL